ncbi:MAG TPA: pseudouridine synthase [Candidatus Saccharimonadales bacterium]|nr:pseudouridine synthase [Candidatus Saccharimonadales bacterium]
MRLNAYLARAGLASRRGADALIKAGKVTVNGHQGQLNDQVTDDDEIKIDGRLVQEQKPRYILLYKPAGYVSTLADPQGRPKVTDLIDISERVAPVGRLDFNTTGALLLTNDGQLAHKLAHPSFEIDKVYEAKVRGKITPEILNKLSIGVEFDGRVSAPAKAKALPDNVVELTIHEGKKHQVKKMLAAVGLPVVKLRRTKYGPLTLAGLKPGQWRELSPGEISNLLQ